MGRVDYKGAAPGKRWPHPPSPIKQGQGLLVLSMVCMHSPLHLLLRHPSSPAQHLQPCPQQQLKLAFIFSQGHYARVLYGNTAPLLGPPHHPTRCTQSFIVSGRSVREAAGHRPVLAAAARAPRPHARWKQEPATARNTLSILLHQRKGFNGPAWSRALGVAGPLTATTVPPPNIPFLPRPHTPLGATTSLPSAGPLADWSTSSHPAWCQPWPASSAARGWRGRCARRRHL
jgi:hypothetical protein